MQTYRFGEFELDLDAQQLRLLDKPVRLERRPLDLLILLVSRHGRMVRREDIIAALWPDNVIIDFDSGLNTLVRKVRNALGDSSDNPHYIETVPGRGYRFIAPVTVSTPLHPDDSAPVSAQPSLLSRPIAALIAVLLIAGSAILIWPFVNDKPSQTRIAVFPFENLTGNAELGYLASGIAEETSTSLAQIDLPDLSVIGGVSARALAESPKSLPQLGREIGVDFVVLSSLRLEGSRMRLTSRLVRVADSEQIWSASFDRELTNVLGLQRELSVAIAEQVRQRLSPDVAAAIDRRQTRNPEAYALYLKGRYEWTRFQPDSVPRALQYYRQAVAKDPGYALAWAGIAHALITSPVTAEANRESIIPASQDALQRALEFGPDLAETQLALGSFHFFLDRDFSSAEAAARQALLLDPNNAMSYMFLGIILSRSDKHVEARTMLRRARELDPLFPLMFANSAVVALAAGEPQDALEFATQAVAINPEFWVGYFHLGNARLALGDYDAAVQAFSSAEKFSGQNSGRPASLRAYALARLGRTSEARSILDDLLSQSAKRDLLSYHVAIAYAGLEEADSALDWLERAVAADVVGCLNIATDDRLETLRTTPRFEALTRRCTGATAAMDLK